MDVIINNYWMRFLCSIQDNQGRNKGYQPKPSCWMEQNDLKLNPDKTDILLIHSRFREGPALDYLQFRDERISISDNILDKHMTFDEQIDHVCKSSINHLRNLSRIRPYLDVNAASTVIYAFITTRLDYCHHLYFGLPKYKVKKLQQIQNIAARYVTGARKYDHITPILVQLHWLPVSYRIVFKHIFFCLQIIGWSLSTISNKSPGTSEIS